MNSNTELQSDSKIDLKFDYIARVFQKTASKKFEHYVITRMWNQLNDTDIKLVPQQYVSRNNDNYALTDIYFPQVGIHVEINEPAHYATVEREIEDNNRRKEIISKTNHAVETIDCRESINGIHSQIDAVVQKIKEIVAYQKQNNTFNVWNPENEYSPTFIQSKGYMNTNDEVVLRTIDDICVLFNADSNRTKRGFLRTGAIEHPTIEDCLIWWPSATNRNGGWNNSTNPDKNEIYESNNNVDKQNGHVHHLLNNEKRTKRVVFYKYKDELGYNFYKYVGLFEIDKEKTSYEKGIVWKKIEDRFELN